MIEVVSDLRWSPPGAASDVEVEFPTEPLRGARRPSQILRAVLNVASNAVKFSRAGG